MLFRSAEIVNSMNKYMIMGLSIYSTYKLIAKFIYAPLMITLRHFWHRRKPITYLIDKYGKGTIIITGATNGLGPAYCKALIKAGYEDFILIDEETEMLDNLKIELL